MLSLAIFNEECLLMEGMLYDKRLCQKSIPMQKKHGIKSGVTARRKMVMLNRSLARRKLVRVRAIN